MLNYQLGLWFFLCLLILSLIGGARLRSKLGELEKAKNRSLEFLRNLKLYVESNGMDSKVYNSMVYLSTRIQIDLGSMGYVHYMPPAANYTIKNYPIVVNLVQQLPTWFPFQVQMGLTFNRLGDVIVQTLQDTILRYLSVNDERKEAIKKQINNPLRLLRVGMQWLLIQPMELLLVFGLASEKRVANLAGSRIIQVISGFLSLFAIISAIVSLIVDWSKFFSILQNLIY